jgi:class III poly(R)-hydroxyalkanoic acid synthase PhaE subunit
LVSFWTRSAESVFTSAFGGERYTLAQGKLLNAQMQYRISRRRIMDKYLEACDMPTRREVDEAHRRIYELNREVKLLKKTLAEMKRSEPRAEVMVELMPEVRAGAKSEVKRSRASKEKKED